MENDAFKTNCFIFYLERTRNFLKAPAFDRSFEHSPEGNDSRRLFRTIQVVEGMVALLFARGWVTVVVDSDRTPRAKPKYQPGLPLIALTDATDV